MFYTFYILSLLFVSISITLLHVNFLWIVFVFLVDVQGCKLVVSNIHLMEISKVLFGGYFTTTRFNRSRVVPFRICELLNTVTIAATTGQPSVLVNVSIYLYIYIGLLLFFVNFTTVQTLHHSGASNSTLS